MAEDIGRDPPMRGKAVEPGAEGQCYPLVRRSPGELLRGHGEHRQPCPGEPGVGDGIEVAEVPRRSPPVAVRIRSAIVHEPDLLPADLGGDRERRVHDALLDRISVARSLAAIQSSATRTVPADAIRSLTNRTIALLARHEAEHGV